MEAGDVSIGPHRMATLADRSSFAERAPRPSVRLPSTMLIHPIAKW